MLGWPPANVVRRPIEASRPEARQPPRVRLGRRGPALRAEVTPRRGKVTSNVTNAHSDAPGVRSGCSVSDFGCSGSETERPRSVVEGPHVSCDLPERCFLKRLLGET